MAYKTGKLFERAIKVIKKENLYFIDDVAAYLGVSKQTVYDHFPTDSDEMDDIKELLNKNRVSDKVKMRKDWKDSTNPTLQMGLYKLISTADERRALAMEYRDHTTKGEKIAGSPIIAHNPEGERPDEL